MDQRVETSTPVMRCVPDLAKQHPKVIVAMLDMAYNIGPTAFCKSSVARYANQGDWTAACKRISEIYTTAQGVKLKGSIVRRTVESENVPARAQGGALMFGLFGILNDAHWQAACAGAPGLPNFGRTTARWLKLRLKQTSKKQLLARGRISPKVPPSLCCCCRFRPLCAVFPGPHDLARLCPRHDHGQLRTVDGRCWKRPEVDALGGA